MSTNTDDKSDVLIKDLPNARRIQHVVHLPNYVRYSALLTKNAEVLYAHRLVYLPCVLLVLHISFGSAVSKS
jgi:hypothetical protein